MKLDAALFRALRRQFNAHPAAVAPYGDAEFCAGFAMRSGDSTVNCYTVNFAGLSCDDVAEVDFHELADADFFLDGPLAAWQEMFADIVANGGATGRMTINSLALLGDRVELRGADPMGLDKFSRFNQTLQAFLDGAASLGLVSAP